MLGKATTDHQGEFIDCFQSQQNGLLSRYGRSAPTQYLAGLMDSTADNRHSSSGVDESESVFTAFMNGNRDLNQKGNNTPIIHPYHMKQEGEVDPDTRPRRDGYGHGQIRHAVGPYVEGLMESQESSGNGFSLGLGKQSSYPAGFFNGFGAMGDVGSLGSSRHNHAKPGPGPRFFTPSIPETVCKHGKEFEIAAAHALNMYESWNNDSQCSNSIERNRIREYGRQVNMFDTQNGKAGGKVEAASSGAMAETEYYKYPQTQFQQDNVNVACKIRAKRGCATHPRSIAERMRRTRISQKIKKLQALCPNMDRQASTADMLDLAVEYIKDLQKQVETLSNTSCIRSKCRLCSDQQLQETDTTT